MQTHRFSRFCQAGHTPGERANQQPKRNNLGPVGRSSDEPDGNSPGNDKYRWRYSQAMKPLRVFSSHVGNFSQKMIEEARGRPGGGVHSARCVTRRRCADWGGPRCPRGARFTSIPARSAYVPGCRRRIMGCAFHPLTACHGEEQGEGHCPVSLASLISGFGCWESTLPSRNRRMNIRMRLGTPGEWRSDILRMDYR